MTGLNDELPNALAELEEEKVIATVKELLADKVKPMDIVGKLQQGVTEVGKRFEKGDYYLSELIICGEIMKVAMQEIEPYMGTEKHENKGTVVIGTVKGDVHDLGKNIVVMLVKGAGYNVVDLGVDVPHQKIVDAIKEHDAKLVGLSVLLTSCLESMKEAAALIKKEVPDTRIIIGGPIVDESVIKHCGADYGSIKAGDAIKAAEKIYG